MTIIFTFSHKPVSLKCAYWRMVTVSESFLDWKNNNNVRILNICNKLAASLWPRCAAAAVSLPPVWTGSHGEKNKAFGESFLLKSLHLLRFCSRHLPAPPSEHRFSSYLLLRISSEATTWTSHVLFSSGLCVTLSHSVGWSVTPPPPKSGVTCWPGTELRA